MMNFSFQRFFTHKNKTVHLYIKDKVSEHLSFGRGSKFVDASPKCYYYSFVLHKVEGNDTIKKRD